MAMVTCRECKKEVSSHAKVCPLCGIKNPARRSWHVLGGLGLLAAVVFIISSVSGGGSDDAGAKDAAAQNAPKVCAATDGQCIFDENSVAAGMACRPLIQRSAKYDYEWTDGVLTPMFSRYINNSKRREIVFIGDQVKFLNAFNAKLPMTYNCTFDIENQKIVNVEVVQGRL